MCSFWFDMECVCEYRSFKNDFFVEVLGKGIDEFKFFFVIVGYEIYKVNF